MELTAFFDALADVPNLRSVAFADVEMTQSGNSYKFDGIAAPTGVAADLGDFTEEYARGSFRRFLSANKNANIPFLHEHNPRDLLASTKSGRLKLEEEARGLRARADIVKTPLAEQVKALVDSGDIAGMSVGMVVGRGNHKIDFGGAKPHRLIQGFKKLLDVCTTFDPAYVSTEAQFRSMAMSLAGQPDSLQQVLMGAYPQLQGEGDETPADTTDEDQQPADDAAPDGEAEDAGTRDESGVVERRSIAARKRALSLYILTTGGVEP